MKLNYQDLFDWVQSMTKTRHDNDMTYCIGMVYVETETELSWPIEPGVVCYKN